MNKYFKLVECNKSEINPDADPFMIVAKGYKDIVSLDGDFALHVTEGSAAIFNMEQLIVKNYLN